MPVTLLEGQESRVKLSHRILQGLPPWVVALVLMAPEHGGAFDLPVAIVQLPDDEGSKPCRADEVTPLPPSEARPANDDENLRDWLRNMVWYHAYSHAEIAAATGLTEVDVVAALRRHKIEPSGRPLRRAEDRLVLLPYPGGRHPRKGFLEGAVRPQRETKVSVFTPWDPASYVVVDAPEAIWSNLGLLYLAHTHVPTVWTQRGVDLEPLEWNARPAGGLEIERKLPNGVAFATKVIASAGAVQMELRFTNGSDVPLSDLRVQNCVMLARATGFDQQTNDNKTFSKPYVACRNADGTRWIITAWERCNKPWANDKCPCMHSDPKFPDCKPGETHLLRGWLSFYEGRDVAGEFRRIEAAGWRKEP